MKWIHFIFHIDHQAIFESLMPFTQKRDVGQEQHFISIHEAKFSSQHQQKTHFTKENIWLEKSVKFLN